MATSFLPRVCQALRQSSFLIFLEWREDINLFSIGRSSTKASWLLTARSMHSIFQPGVSAWNKPKKVAKSQHPRKWQSSHITPTEWECRLVQVFEILSLSFIRGLWHNFLEVAWWNFSGTVREVFQKATSDSQAQRRWCCHSYGWMLWMSVKMLPWPSLDPPVHGHLQTVASINDPNRGIISCLPNPSNEQKHKVQSETSKHPKYHHKSFIKFFQKLQNILTPPFFGTGRFDEYLETPKQPPTSPPVPKNPNRSNWKKAADLNGCGAWREVKQGQLTETATWTYPRMPFVWKRTGKAPTVHLPALQKTATGSKGCFVSQSPNLLEPKIDTSKKGKITQ